MKEVAKRILEAARMEFTKYGYDGARLGRIAEAAGVHTAQIHYYYGGKKALYAEAQKALQPIDTAEITEILLQVERPLPERIQIFYERFGGFVQSLQGLDGEGVSSATILIPPLLRSPRSLALPAWEDTLVQAQRLGMIRPLPVSLLLAQQWSVAMMPLWFLSERDTWPTYYQSEAPAHFWALAKNIP
jgi:AcrR family transcriptional regulator